VVLTQFFGFALQEHSVTTASIIQRMFESMPGVDCEVTNVDVDNYIVMMKLRSQNDIGMMDTGMMNP